MRPGHEAPENWRRAAWRGASCRRFNEAGARGPGKRSTERGAVEDYLASMRPGHEAPENRGDFFVGGMVRPASMRPGHEAPENLTAQAEKWAEDAASMRPGHEAPENIGP